MHLRRRLPPAGDRLLHSSSTAVGRGCSGGVVDKRHNTLVHHGVPAGAQHCLPGVRKYRSGGCTRLSGRRQELLPVRPIPLLLTAATAAAAAATATATARLLRRAAASVSTRGILLERLVILFLCFVVTWWKERESERRK